MGQDLFPVSSSLFFASASFVITGMFALFLTAFRSEEALLLKPRMRAYKQKSDARKSSISSWLIESRQWSSARFIRARVMFFVLRFWASSLNVKACPVQSMRVCDHTVQVSSQLHVKGPFHLSFDMRLLSCQVQAKNHPL